jgi:hypothetical protein
VSVFAPSDQYRYSLYGTLDVNADTQVVRVSSLADSVQVGAAPSLEATVSLENLDTGAQVALQDSLMTVTGDTRVHNFWTVHPIEPGTAYRIAVRSEGEVVTTVETSTPAEAPAVSYGRALRLPCQVDRFGDPIPGQNTFELQVGAPEQLAALQVLYPITRLRGAQRPAPVDSLLARFGHLDAPRTPQVDIAYAPDLIALNTRDEGCIGRSSFFRDSVLVAVARGGPEWPDWLDVPLNELARPDSFSNVQGGHGFVGGIYSDTVQVPILERRP